MENYVTLVKEWLDRRGYTIDSVTDDFAIDGALHTCTITYDGINYPMGSGITKKDAKQGAYRYLWDAIKDRPEPAEKPASGAQKPTAGRQMRAMCGDKILATIVTEHFMSSPGMTPGMLHDNFKSHTTNEFLFARYAALAENDALPDGLANPTGQAQVDPTVFEEWVFTTYEDHEKNMHTTAATVLHALGLP